MDDIKLIKFELYRVLMLRNIMEWSSSDRALAVTLSKDPAIQEVLDSLPKKGEPEIVKVCSWCGNSFHILWECPECKPFKETIERFRDDIKNGPA